ncbi:phosphatidylinositol-3,5-bisphosphate 5-phosphatase [Saccharomycopsis crataegensis]|uniref:Phosphatidylinositol-3,5-bisphosphate 5-phosphatase n=1 Tax=Saccharomycopsis crataegensis TaxID=43959 RepID=A0AAV5QGH0_9ASCO|nr:phosphatidylinositol-3,5-bisphosphate 5-phosphatase [Saccharomycopsis crataegensis]
MDKKKKRSRDDEDVSVSSNDSQWQKHPLPPPPLSKPSPGFVSESASAVNSLDNNNDEENTIPQQSSFDDNVIFGDAWYNKNNNNNNNNNNTPPEEEEDDDDADDNEEEDFVYDYENAPLLNGSDNNTNTNANKTNIPLFPGDKNFPTLKPRKLILQKYTIYDTEERMYIIGSNNRETMFRILEIDLTNPVDKLNIIEDNVYFNRKEIIQILNTLEETKNLVKRISCYGLLGFIKFTHNYYLHTVTERSIVGILGGHNIYKIDSTKLIPVINEKNKTHFKKNSSKDALDNEQRFLSIFEDFSLDQNFYFSYTYDITNTLQKNFMNEKFKAFKYKTQQKNSNLSKDYNDSTIIHQKGQSPETGENSNSEINISSSINPDHTIINDVDNEDRVKSLLGTEEEAENYLGSYNEMFVWNIALLKPAVSVFDRTFDWFQPIIHGFFNQANISIYNKKIYITVIARRSHHFAGARFLKRGVNDKGNVANEVESEQIVCDELTTSFHDNANGYFMNPRYTSFVQHRGSIPLFWTQDSNIKIAKPPISMTLNDPFYSVSALHFEKLFKRYGSKLFILNLIKQKEKTPRESILGKEFRECIEFLNQFIPESHRLDYVAWDMSRASKSSSHGQDVLEFLETYADRVIGEIGIFHNSLIQDHSNLQIGICRTNCIDCLDRTNAAQFIIGKKALGHQLKLLGVYDNVYLDYDSDAVNLLTDLFHNHGNIIALQYGGSNLVNTMETYRKINQWSSKKNDLIENFKRFYSNSFVDPLRQDSINLFLGNYDYSKLGSKFLLWDLPNDYYLHNDISGYKPHLKKLRSFNYWWNEDVFNYWKSIHFPPPRYLLNGEIDKFNIDENFPIIARELLDELIIDLHGGIISKRVFSNKPQGAAEEEQQQQKQQQVTKKSVLKKLYDINYRLKVMDRKCKQRVDVMLEPYPGKQIDSYWTEYYTPRKLTNFKLLFDMNMKSSLAIDAKELSGAKFSEDREGETVDKDRIHFSSLEMSPFESRKPGIINQKFKQLYSEDFVSQQDDDNNDNNDNNDNSDNSEFFRFLWNNHKTYHAQDDDDDDQLQFLYSQLNGIIRANENLGKFLTENASGVYGTGKNSMFMMTDNNNGNRDDTNKPFMGENYDDVNNEEVMDHGKSSYLGKFPLSNRKKTHDGQLSLGRSMNYSNILNLLPNNINFNKLINKTRENDNPAAVVDDEINNSPAATSQGGETPIYYGKNSHDNREIMSPELGAIDKNKNFNEYLTNPMMSIKNLNLYNDDHQDEKAYLTTTTMTLHDGTNDEHDRTTNFDKFYGEETVIYHECEDKLSIISDFYNESLMIGDHHQHHGAVTTGSSSLSVNDHGEHVFHSYDSEEESSRILLDTTSVDYNNYEFEGLLINPALYEEKFREYKVLNVNNPGVSDISPRDIEAFKFSVGLATTKDEYASDNAYYVTSDFQKKGNNHNHKHFDNLYANVLDDVEYHGVPNTEYDTNTIMKFYGVV